MYRLTCLALRKQEENRERVYQAERERVLSEVLTWVECGRFTDARNRWVNWAGAVPERTSDAFTLIGICDKGGDTVTLERVARAWLRRSDGVTRWWFRGALIDMTLFHRRHDLMWEADGWTGDALQEDAPDYMELPRMARRGGVLVDLGRIDEALPLLNKVMEEPYGLHYGALAAAYLAKVYGNMGDLDLAAKWYERARYDAARNCVAIHAVWALSVEAGLWEGLH